MGWRGEALILCWVLPASSSERLMQRPLPFPPPADLLLWGTSGLAATRPGLGFSVLLSPQVQVLSYRVGCSSQPGGVYWGPVPCNSECSTARKAQQ